ncbi:hypothetical protein Sjap_026042 [Stephania japonica]|uniref:CCHC-type domain-containing protein n=1 Tax=Stephania japonica TaxID=461633 RepID=A0AAP0E2V3_9MAGN
MARDDVGMAGIGIGTGDCTHHSSNTTAAARPQRHRVRDQGGRDRGQRDRGQEPRSDDARTGKRETRRCFRCGRRGHLKLDCRVPSPRREQGRERDRVHAVARQIQEPPDS